MSSTAGQERVQDFAKTNPFICMKVLTSLVLFGLAGMALADGTSTTSAQATDPSVLDELTQRSGISRDEMKRVLDNCDATQLSMNFCSLRDQIVADRKLQQVIIDKKAQMPACSAAIDAKVAAWQKKRDASCAKSAAKEFGGGSMEPTARLLCSTASTTDYISVLSAQPVFCTPK